MHAPAAAGLDYHNTFMASAGGRLYSGAVLDRVSDCSSRRLSAVISLLRIVKGNLPEISVTDGFINIDIISN